MPKMRTNSAAKKRFKKTGSGKVFHRRTNKGHLNAKKSGARKRRLKLKGFLIFSLGIKLEFGFEVMLFRHELPKFETADAVDQ